jgi:outer membrane receptor for ferrienterochelin and colicins
MLKKSQTLIRQFTFILFCLSLFAVTKKVYSQQNDANKPVDLFDMSIEDLMDVEVTSASKKAESLNEAPGVMTVVPNEEIDIYGDRNLLQLLQRQPSVYTRGSYMYPNNIASFRGDMPTHQDLHNLILFNGRPIRETGFGGADFPIYMSFPIAGLDSVEMIRGPGSMLYGTNAFTGVINLRTRIPDHNVLSISGIGGSYGYYESNVNAGGKSGDLGYITALRVTGQDGYNYRMTDDKGIFDSQADRNRSISAVAHLEYGGFTFDTFAVDLETFNLGTFPRWSCIEHQFGVKKLFANAGYRFPLHERATLEFNLTYNLQESHVASTSPQLVGLNTSDVLGEVTFFTNPIDNLNVTFGYLEEYRNNYKPDDDYYQSIPIYHYQPQSAYTQADYKLIDSVKVIAGAQWNESSQGYEDTVSRYGVILTPFKKWGVKLLRGEAFRAPFAMETDVFGAAIVGNKNLQPETITTYDAQIFYNDDKTYAAVTYFNSATDDLIIRDTSVSPASYKNGGEQKFDGIELEAKRFLTPHWHILGSTTYQNNKQTSDLNPSTSPDYMVKLGTGYIWNWGTASFFYSYFSKPPRLDSEVVVNPEPGDLNLLSLNIQIDPSQWLDIPKGRAELMFRVENCLNEKIWVPEFNRGGNPNSLPDGSGTTFYAGLKLYF